MLLDSPDLEGLPDFVVASAARPRPSAAIPGKLRGDALALERRAVPAILGAPRSARDRLPRLDRARRERRRDRQSRRSPPKWCALRAERARLLGYESYAHYRLADTMAKTPRGARSACSNRSGRPASRRAPQRGGGAAGDRRRGGRQLPGRALGLALSRREAPQGRVRFRRERGQALSPARPHDRGGLLRRAPPVRR